MSWNDAISELLAFFESLDKRSGASERADERADFWKMCSWPRLRALSTTEVFGRTMGLGCARRRGEELERGKADA
jgi:hypothetical protein